MLEKRYREPENRFLMYLEGGIGFIIAIRYKDLPTGYRVCVYVFIMGITPISRAA